MEELKEYKTLFIAGLISAGGWVVTKLCGLATNFYHTTIKKIDSIESFRHEYDNSERQHIVYRAEIKEDIKEIKEKVDVLYQHLISK